MRRFLLLVSGLAIVLLLAGCGNKGPLVRAPAHAPVAPAPATSVAADRGP